MTTKPHNFEPKTMNSTTTFVAITVFCWLNFAMGFVVVDRSSSPFLDRKRKHSTVPSYPPLDFSLQKLRTPHLSSLSTNTQLFSTAATNSIVGTAPTLKSLLKKPSKVLTVGVEVIAPKAEDEFDPTAISVLSMQLRKSKISSIWCRHSPQLIQVIKEEQETAKGNFPGPVPIIFAGPVSDAKAAIDAGASAIVVTVADWRNLQDIEAEMIWEVSSVEDVQKTWELTGSLADAFLVQGTIDDEAMKEIQDLIPTSSLCIASLDPMQPDGAEIEQGRHLKGLGCASIVIKEACVGDAEDVEYTQFLVNGLTSKASSEFKFSGLTGSTNGHFGGVQANNRIKWRRFAQLS